MAMKDYKTTIVGSAIIGLIAYSLYTRQDPSVINSFVGLLGGCGFILARDSKSDE